MTQIAGVFRLDGGPIERGLPARLLGALEMRGAEGSGTWHGRDVVLASVARWTTAEDAGQDQPTATAGFRCRIVADARLDNREEIEPLVRAWLLDRSHPPSDAALIAAAYLTWGEECLQRLAGDYAFVLWDGQERRLFAARDPIGLRPLYYRESARQFACGSSTAAVVAAWNEKAARNDALLQDMLAGRFDRWVCETCYRDVFRIPPGHRLTIDQSGMRLTRFYTLGARGPVRLRGEQGYADAFRAHLERAVSVRLRSLSPTAILVSGGLDSSSIACLAHRLAGSDSKAVRLYSSTFDRTPAADEREYLAEIERRCVGHSLTRVPSDDCVGLREFGAQHGYPLDEPEIGVDRGLTLGVLRAARRDGCRAVLSGYWADQVLSGDAYASPALLRDVPLSKVFREAQHFARVTGQAPAYLVPYALLRPLLPAGLRQRIGRRTRPNQWLARPVDGSEPVRKALPAPALESEVARLLYRQLTDGLQAARLAMHATTGRYLGLEWRLPFLDLEVVEFILGLPRGLAFKDGVTKRLLRLAMADILPEPIRTRRTFARFDALTERGLNEHRRSTIKDLLVNSLTIRDEFVDYKQVEAAWSRYWQAPDQNSSRPLVAFLTVEAWLRHYEASAAPAVTTPEAAAAS